jgi:hypothetical protein
MTERRVRNFGAVTINFESPWRGRGAPGISVRQLCGIALEKTRAVRRRQSISSKYQGAALSRAAASVDKRGLTPLALAAYGFDPALISRNRANSCSASSACPAF